MNYHINSKIIDPHYKIFLWSMFIASTNIFGFGQFIPGLSNLYSTDILFILLGLTGVASILFSFVRNKNLKFKGTFTGTYFLWLLIMVLFILYSNNQYVSLGQTLTYTLKEAFYFIVPIILYFAFIQYEHKGPITYFYKVIAKVSIVSGIVALVYFVMNTATGLNIFDISNERNGTVRFTIGYSILTFSTLLSFYRILNFKKMKCDFLNIFLGLFQIIVCSKTRMLILSFFIALFFVFLNSKFTNGKNKLNSVILFLFMITIMLILAPFVIDKMIIYVNGDSSITARFATLEYYGDLFLQKPILGIGLVTEHKSIPAWHVMHGEAGFFYTNDVGIVGYLITFGLVGIFWLLFYIVSRLHYVSKCYDFHSRFCKYMILFHVVTFVSLFYGSYLIFNFLLIDMLLEYSSPHKYCYGQIHKMRMIEKPYFIKF